MAEEKPPAAASTKHHKICSVADGLAVTAARSSEIRHLFDSALHAVELLSHVVTESMHNGGLVASQDNASLGHALTLDDGSGVYLDNRSDRRIHRSYDATSSSSSSSTTPTTALDLGRAQADMDWLDTASNVLPWLASDLLLLGGDSPQNSLAASTWVQSAGGGLVAYPPNTSHNGHPHTIHDTYDGNLVARLGMPYRASAAEDSMMISATAPVYYQGTWEGYDFAQRVWLGTAGMELRLEHAVTEGILQAKLDDTLTASGAGVAGGSFALLVHASSLQVMAVSSQTMRTIGVEPPAQAAAAGEETTTTLPSLLDEGFSSTSPHWERLHQALQATAPAGFVVIDLATQEQEEQEESSQPYYAMYNRWDHNDSGTDWALLVFAPVAAVDKAISLAIDCVPLEEEGAPEDMGECTVTNNGILDVTVTASATVSTLQLQDPLAWSVPQVLRPGESLAANFTVTNEQVDTDTSSSLTFMVNDDGYADCHYQREFDVPILASTFFSKSHHHHLGESSSLGDDLGTGVRAIGLGLCGLAVCTAIFCMTWTFLHRRTAIVRASQAKFLHMVAAGCLVLSTAIVPMSMTPEMMNNQDACDAFCVVTPWLVATGFVTMLAALFSKIWRINKIIFHGVKTRRIVVTARDILVPFGSLFGTNVALLLLWTFLGGVSFSAADGICSSDESTHVVVTSLLAAVNLAAMLTACFQMNQVRDIRVEYEETTYISVCLFGMLQLGLIGTPVLYLVEDQPKAAYLVKSGIVFVVSMSVLVLIFLPKITLLGNEEKVKAQKRLSSIERAMRSASPSSGVRVRSKSPEGNAGAVPSDGLKLLRSGKRALYVKLKETSKRVKTLETIVRENMRSRTTGGERKEPVIENVHILAEQSPKTDDVERPLAHTPGSVMSKESKPGSVRSKSSLKSTSTPKTATPMVSFLEEDASGEGVIVHTKDNGTYTVKPV